MAISKILIVSLPISIAMMIHSSREHFAEVIGTEPKIFLLKDRILSLMRLKIVG